MRDALLFESLALAIARNPAAEFDRIGYEHAAWFKPVHESEVVAIGSPPQALDARYTLRLPTAVKAKALRIGAAAVIAAIEAEEEGGVSTTETAIYPIAEVRGRVPRAAVPGDA